MDEETRAFITWALGTLISLSVILGLGVRFILVPYLREHLIKPVKHVEKQVSENHHGNEQPTVLDRIDDVGKQVSVLAKMFDGHLEWSQGWVSRMEDEIREIKEKHGWGRTRH